jgi:catechol 2,3-dioxygenase-like lactoylglutathione lyase family enzyme
LKQSLFVLLALFAMIVGGCDSEQPEAAAERTAPVPDIVATNAFFYYVDVEAAWQFYRDVLGFETVVDYGFAKIMRITETSYVTLVAAESGMHSAEEPKTVTLNLISDELDAWYQHLQDAEANMHSEIDGRPQLEFVVSDPEGYLLRFQRFNPHAKSDSFVAQVAELSPLASSAGEFSVRAAVYVIYLHDLATTRSFYDGLFARQPVATPEWGLIYQMAGSGFLGLADGADDLLQPTELNGVTLSFLTSDVDAWFERASTWPGFELRTPEIFNESDMVRVFVGYDPEGFFLEWDTFLELEANRKLLEYLPE